MQEHDSSYEQERAVLAGIMVSGNAFYDAADVVSAADFYIEQHRYIWDAMEAIIEDGAKPDLPSVAAKLRSMGRLKLAGGAVALSDIHSDNADVANVRHYAKAVKDLATVRRLNALGTKLSAGVGAEDLLELAQSELDVIAGRSTGSTAEEVGPVAKRVVNNSIAIHRGERPVEGVTTGFSKLDELVTTMGPGELWVLAARPSVGKTALAINILQHITQDLKKAGLVVSLEMSREELTERLIGGIAGVNTRALKSGKLNEAGVPNDIERINDAAKQLADSKLIIEDDMSVTPSQLRAIARRIQSRHGLDLIVVDYLQLMDAPGHNANDRAGFISRGMKKIAKSLHVPVLLLSQLSRRVEQEQRDRPILSDLRDSGNIEQDADKVLFMTRDIDHEPNLAQLHLGKNRQGPVGSIPLRFDGEFTKFAQGEWADFTEE